MTHESIDKSVHYNKKLKYSIWSMLLQFIHKLLALQSTLSIAAPRNKKYYYITPTHIGSVVAHITHNHIPPYIFCTSRISLFIFFSSRLEFFSICHHCTRQTHIRWWFMKFSIANSHFLNSIFVVLGQLRGYF